MINKILPFMLGDGYDCFFYVDDLISAVPSGGYTHYVSHCVIIGSGRLAYYNVE